MNDEVETMRDDRMHARLQYLGGYCLVLVVLLISLARAQEITQAEYFIGTDPGAGSATPISITPGTGVNFSNLNVPSAGLPADVPHQLFVRYFSTEGNWSRAESRFFFILSPQAGTVQLRNVVSLEYWWDANAATPVELTDAPGVSWAALLPSTGFAEGLHTLNLRYWSSDGRPSSVERRFLWISGPQSGTVQIRRIVEMEYRWDSDPEVIVDLVDDETADFNAWLQTTELSFGLHSYSVRYRDDVGIVTPWESRFVLFVSPHHGNPSPSYLTAAEYWLNVDPGAGNGISVPLPEDSSWNSEQEESAAVTLTGLPVGLHLFGLRFRDNQGHWAQAFADTVIISPVLTIRRVGMNIVLDWIADPASAPFRVYRADEVSGPFVPLAMTDSLTYTDMGEVSSPETRRFYQVTFSRPSLSSYRLPPLTP